MDGYVTCLATHTLTTADSHLCSHSSAPSRRREALRDIPANGALLPEQIWASPQLSACSIRHIRTGPPLRMTARQQSIPIDIAFEVACTLMRLVRLLALSRVRTRPPRVDSGKRYGQILLSRSMEARASPRRSVARVAFRRARQRAELRQQAQQSGQVLSGRRDAPAVAGDARALR